MDDLTRLVEQAHSIAMSSSRGDLAARLDRTRDRLAAPGVRVLVVGEFKQGKSLLVNALVNASVCPVDDDIATAVPTVVHYAPEPIATLVSVDTVDASESDENADGRLRRQAVPLDELAQHVSERGNAGNERRLAYAEVGLPRRLLEPGLVIVDTPGVGGMGSAYTAATMAELPTADAVILVSDAAQEYSEPEIQFLRQAIKLCPNVVCVLTKIDLYPQWRRIADLDRIHLAGAGVTAPLLPVSSTMRVVALDSGDREVNRESGFPALVGYVQRDILDRAEQLSCASVVNDVQYVAEHLSLSLQGELAALTDPERNHEMIARLEAARNRATGLRRETARWQQTLNDGIVDLQSDIEYDMRDRTRLIVREAEEIIAEADPGVIADQFDEWFRRRVAAAVADNFTWAHERSEWLAGQVSNFFADSGGAELPGLHVSDTSGVLDPVREMATVDPDRTGFAGKILIGMRGSYGGVLMFGLLTGLMGMALINPISIGAGVVLGTKAYGEDKQAKLNKRRFDAQVAVRRQVDEVLLHVGKQAKDRLRQVQRLLRDHFSDIAEELQRSLTETIADAQRAAQTEPKDRDRRIAEIKRELARIEALRQQCNALAPRSPAGVLPAP